LRFAGIATGLMTAVLTVTYSSSIRARTHPAIALVMVYLLPQVLTVALPFGLFVGVLSGLRATRVTTRVKRSMALMMLVCSLVTLLIAGWLLPASNQAFRELMFGGPIARGTNELTLGELRQLADDRIVIPLIASRRAFDFHFRIALAFAPLALGLFATGVSAVRQRAARRMSVAVLALAGWFAYNMLASNSPSLMYHAPFEVSERVPPIIAAWSANLVFLSAALLLHLRTRGRSATDPSRPDDGRRSADQPAIPPA
jgi:lipopolysaccharide export LptBFGC system permease protein LptF